MIGLANYLERESEVSSKRKCNSMKCDKKNNQHNNEEDDDNEEDAENEENVDNEEDADNNEEDDENEEEANNEDQVDNEESVDQVFKKVKKLPCLNAAKRSMKKEYGKVLEKQHQKKRKMETSESEQPKKKKSNCQKSTYKGTMKKSRSKKNPIIEESPKRFIREGKKIKRQKGRENMKKAEEETQVESDEDVSYDGSNSDDERLLVGKEKKKKKG
ncbi:hypothetical protein Tco_0896503, partial [Tanacetum coccineum]